MNYNKIRELCVDKRISLRKLAAKIEMSQPGFMRMLKSESMSVSTLEKIAKALKTPPGDFFDDHPYYTAPAKEPEGKPQFETSKNPLDSIDRNVSKIVEILEAKNEGRARTK